MIETLLWIFLSLYCTLAVLIVIGIVRESSRKDYSDAIPFVSIIIPVRNEERNVRQCLESVLEQTYPTESYEVILVNDNSTDRTLALAQEAEVKYARLIVMSVDEHASRVGKLVALDAGIRRSRGEVILLTDGDIVVPPTWIEQAIRHLPERVGIAGGLTLPTGNSLIASAQTLDWTFLLGVACGAIGLKIPLSIIANNFALRRTAHDEVGGFASVRNSVDDDFLMFKDIVSKTKWGYRFILHPDCVNETLPCESLFDALNQKHRWGRGGFGVNAAGYVLILTSAFTHWTLLLSSFVVPGLALWGWGVKCLADLLILVTTLFIVRRTKLLSKFILFQVYYILYIFLMPFWIAFVQDVEWKGRVYKRVV